jgi:poly-gamma-glutamate capsule biosynthesis protein CapA/YwtB (metallophosphatase superfamily)
LFFSIGLSALGQEIGRDIQERPEMIDNARKTAEAAVKDRRSITIFMCGDVMAGRGIDQVLPHPGDPTIYESYMKSARGYVKIAEEVNGPIDYPVNFSYIWGDALKELDRFAPDVSIINFETSVTKSNEYWKGKGINYRMHPDNIPILTAAKIEVCSLANNHVLDWGYSGLLETLESLDKANIKLVDLNFNKFKR